MTWKRKGETEGRNESKEGLAKETDQQRKEGRNQEGKEITKEKKEKNK